MSALSPVLRRRARDADAGADLDLRPSATRVANAALSVAMDGGSKLVVGPEVKLRSTDVIHCDTLVVEGLVEAKIDARVMQLAEHGMFRGSAEFDFVQVRGHFEGNLTVRQTLVLRATGTIAGKVRCRRLAIEEGGQLSGRITCDDALAIAGGKALANAGAAPTSVAALDALCGVSNPAKSEPARVKRACPSGRFAQQAYPEGADMNKAELIAAASADTDLTKAECSRVLDAILKNLCGSLSRGNSVYLAGFGTFGVSIRMERIGRNPRSGEPMTLKASKGAKFTAAKALKDMLNSTT